MLEQDILLWPDGYWCYRFELCDGFTRDYPCRVVEYKSEKWLTLTQSPPNSSNGRVLNWQRHSSVWMSFS